MEEANNKSICKLFEKHRSAKSSLLFEGTVDTGFEKISLKELQKKIPVSDCCSCPGRIYFELIDSNYEEAYKLRSVDHLALVVHVEQVEFKGLKEDDMKYFKELAERIDVKNYLRQWVKMVGFEGDYLPNTDSNGNLLAFRVTGKRSFQHSFGSMDAARVFGGTLQDRFGWKVSMTEYDLDILLYIIGERVLVALKLTKQSQHHRNIVQFGPTTLRATVCYNLLQMAELQNGDVLVDPLCGGGSIPIECAFGFSEVFVFCGDYHEKAIERTRMNLENISSSTVRTPELFHWDATKLPFRNESIDVIVTDMPFGKRSGSVSDNRLLYMDLLREFARVLRRKSSRLIVLTNDRRSLLKAHDSNPYFYMGRIMQVKLGGLKPAVFSIRRNDLVFGLADPEKTKSAMSQKRNTKILGEKYKLRK